MDRLGRTMGRKMSLSRSSPVSPFRLPRSMSVCRHAPCQYVGTKEIDDELTKCKQNASGNGFRETAEGEGNAVAKRNNLTARYRRPSNLRTRRELFRHS